MQTTCDICWATLGITFIQKDQIQHYDGTVSYYKSSLKAVSFGILLSKECIIKPDHFSTKATALLLNSVADFPSFQTIMKPL